MCGRPCRNAEFLGLFLGEIVFMRVNKDKEILRKYVWCGTVLDIVILDWGYKPHRAQNHSF